MLRGSLVVWREITDPLVEPSRRLDEMTYRLTGTSREHCQLYCVKQLTQTKVRALLGVL